MAPPSQPPARSGQLYETTAWCPTSQTWSPSAWRQLLQEAVCSHCQCSPPPAPVHGATAATRVCHPDHLSVQALLNLLCYLLLCTNKPAQQEHEAEKWVCCCVGVGTGWLRDRVQPAPVSVSASIAVAKHLLAVFSSAALLPGSTSCRSIACWWAPLPGWWCVGGLEGSCGVGGRQHRTTEVYW